MANSPKCPLCKDNGLDSQTYKVAGRPEFKCATCKHTFQRSEIAIEA